MLQQERERALRQQQEQTPDVRLAPPPLDIRLLVGNESPCFTINSIVLDGPATAEFNWALTAANFVDGGTADPALGRCLGTRDINEVMKRVQNAIIRRGFITTRVLAAPQDLAAGVLVLTVVPGRIRTARFTDGTDPRATSWNAVPANSGDLLNLRAIEQALENFKRVPTAEADIQITPPSEPQAQPGESDIVIRWKQAFPLRFSASVDDAGTDATGKYQGGFVFAYDHPLRLNDLFYASYQHDLGGGDAGERGSEGYTVHYSVPFGYWLVGLTTNQYDYHQSVAGIDQTYIYSGESTNSDVRLSRVVYRDAVRKSSALLRAWARSSKNFIDDTEVEVQRRRMGGWEFGLSHREFINRATLDVSLAYRRGTGAWNSLPAPEEAFGEGTSRLRLFIADAQFNSPFILGTSRLRYLGSWRWQANRTPLVPQDRFSIGGRYTVRGFDGENTLLAERGWFIRNDLGWFIGRSKQELYVGADYGTVSGPSAALLQGSRLAGAVLGVRGGYKHLNYDLFAGWPIDKPDGFDTAHTTGGFSLNWIF